MGGEKEAWGIMAHLTEANPGALLLRLPPKRQGEVH